MWFKWFLVILYVALALSNIALIDEERKRTTKAGAMMGVIINGLLIWGILHYF